jgi:zinc finger FYVE domain-containing protein 26
LNREIDEKEFLFLLTEYNDFSTVRHRLALLGTDSIAIAETLLEKTQRPETIQFLIQYLMELKNSCVQPQTSSQVPLYSQLSHKELGFKTLLLLPSDLQLVYKNLLNHPQLMVESLLMSERCSVVSVIFRELSSMRNDDLVLHYASKALEYVPPSKRTLQDVKLWLMDETNAEAMRRQHYYSTAPNYLLTTTLLDLCFDVKKIARWCIESASKLSSFAFAIKLSPSEEALSGWTRMDAMSAIAGLISYAKRRLHAEMANMAKDELAQNLMTTLELTSSRFELIKKLSLLSNINANDMTSSKFCERLPFSLDLNALNDTNKARQLRDALIEEDRMEEALDVAAKCYIEREPVLIAWGLNLLSAGKYEHAKEKFRLCLTPQSEIQGREDLKLMNNAALTKILNVLQSEPPFDAHYLRQKQEQIAQNLSLIVSKSKKQTSVVSNIYDSTLSLESYLKALQISPQKSGSISLKSENKSQGQQLSRRRQAPLDSLRYMQCIYYLQQYGTQQDLLHFWLKYNLLEDAMRYLINQCSIATSYTVGSNNSNTVINSNDRGSANDLQQQIASLFIELVLHVISHDDLSQFKQVLQKIDPTLSKSRRLLSATCKYFAHRGMYNLLLEFEVIMRDWPRAGFTCIRLFNLNQDYATKIHYLTLSKDYLQQALQEGQFTSPESSSAWTDNWDNFDSTDVTTLSSPNSSRRNNTNKNNNPSILRSSSTGSETEPKPKVDLHKYFRLVNLQLEVCRVVNTLMKNKALESPLDQTLTLFGDTQAKCEIAMLMLIHHNVDLGFRIVQEFQLPIVQIYQNALVKLTQSKQFKYINEVMKSVSVLLSDDEWNRLVQTVIKVYVEHGQDSATAEKFIPLLRGDEVKISALITCGKLKSAYLLAVKLGSIHWVKVIRDEAKKKGVRRELELCEKFLAAKGIKE